MFRRAVQVVVLGAALALLAPAVAQADLNWSSPQTLSPTERDSTQAQVVVDRHGNSTAVWDEFDGAFNRVRVAFAPTGGNFGAPEFLSPDNVDTSGVRIAANADGAALVTWTAQGDTVGRYRSAGGGFGQQELLVSGVAGASTAVGPNGGALLAYVRPGDNGVEHVIARDRSPTGTLGSEATLQTLAPGNANVEVDVHAIVPVFDRQGNALVAWASNQFSFNQDRVPDQIHAARRPAGEGFETAQLITRRTNTYGQTDRQVNIADLALENNNAVIGIARVVGAAFQVVETSSRSSAQGTWGAPEALAGTGGMGNGAYGLGLELDAGGNLLATWTEDASFTPSAIYSAYRPAGGSFAPRQTVAQGADVRGATLGMDQNGSAVVMYTTDDGARTHVWARERTSGPFGAYSAADELADPGDIGGASLGVGAGGHAAAVWSRNNGVNDLVQASLGNPPSVPPPPPPPPPPAPPSPSAIQPARPIENDKATVLTVEVSRRVDRLEWSFGGSGPTIVAPGSQRSVRLRASRFTATVKAIGPGGTRTFSRTFTGPRAPTDENSRKVNNGIPSGAADVFAVGDADVLTGRSSSCGSVIVYARLHTLSGCFLPTDTLGDIPGGERGVLEPLADALRLDQSDAPLMRRAVELTDGYVARGPVAINGVWPVEPTGSARLVSFPQAKALTSSNASLRVAGHPMGPAGRSFNLRLDPSSRVIPLGSIQRPAGLSGISGFPLVGDFSVTLLPSEARIETMLRLPGFIEKNGAPVQYPKLLRATPYSLLGDGLSAGPDNVRFGPLPVHGFKMSYAQARDQWEGQGSPCVFGACLPMEPPSGGLAIRNGRLAFARAGLDFRPPGLSLGQFFHLEHFGFGLGFDPTRLFGDVRLGAGGFVKINGQGVFALPSARTPYFLQRSEVGNGFPEQVYRTPFSRPTVAGGGSLGTDLPIVGQTVLTNGYFAVEDPGYAAMGGGLNLGIPDVISLQGAVSGEYDVTRPAYNLHGDIRACVLLVKDICAGSTAHTSRGPDLAGGTGACVQLGPVSIGGGIQWKRPHLPFIWPLDGCKWSVFAINVRGAGARAAQDGGYRVTVRRGSPSPAVKLIGRGGAPLVRVSGPGGQTLDSTDKGLDLSPGGKIRILRYTGRESFTVVGLQDAEPGTYTISTLPGSVPVTATGQATDPPDAKVTARLRRKGGRRVLTYNVRRRKGQTVTFFEISPGGNARALKTISGGRGKLRFSPLPGRGTRRIVARFALSGIDAEVRTVARFKPTTPVLGQVRRLKLRRKGTRVRVSWKRVRGAARYEIALTPSRGRQRFLTVRRRRALVRGIAKSASGMVTVRAVARYREGKIAGARFKRIAPPPSRFERLRRCKVTKRKVTGCGEKAKSKNKKKGKRKKRGKNKKKGKTG